MKPTPRPPHLSPLSPEVYIYFFCYHVYELSHVHVFYLIQLSSKPNTNTLFGKCFILFTQNEGFMSKLSLLTVMLKLVKELHVL